MGSEDGISLQIPSWLAPILAGLALGAVVTWVKTVGMEYADDLMKAHVEASGHTLEVIEAEQIVSKLDRQRNEDAIHHILERLSRIEARLDNGN